MKNNKDITTKIARLLPRIDEAAAEKTAAAEYAAFVAPIVAANPAQPCLILRQPRKVCEVVYVLDGERMLFAGGRVDAKRFLLDLRSNGYRGVPAYCLKRRGGLVPM